jgi:hypothetical protein
LIAAFVVGAAAPEYSARSDITPDAVTMATTRNLWTGEVAWLTDGRTPDTDPGAGALKWEGVGLVAVSWSDTVRIERIRVYLGDMTRYRVFGYLGGHFNQRGDRVGVETAVYGREDMVSAEKTGWYDISFPPETPIDNLSFQVIDGAAIYEIQILGPDDESHKPRLACGGHTGGASYRGT